MDDIAVVGLGLRFPGNAACPEELWKVLERGESQWAEFPKDRLNIDGYYHPGGDRQGSVSGSSLIFRMADSANTHLTDIVSRRPFPEGRRCRL